MTMPSWNDEVTIIRRPAPGDPVDSEYEPASGRLGDMVRYIMEDVPIGLRPFHSISLADGGECTSAEVEHIASLPNYRAWRAQTD